MTIRTTALPDLITNEEAAQMLLMAAKTLENKRQRGEGPPYIRYPGRTIRYSRRAVADYIEQHTIVPDGTT